jgi:hypothetical protein
VEWIDLSQDRDLVEGSCEHGNELSGSGKLLNIFTTDGFLRRAQLYGVSYNMEGKDYFKLLDVHLKIILKLK